MGASPESIQSATPQVSPRLEPPLGSFQGAGEVLLAHGQQGRQQLINITCLGTSDSLVDHSASRQGYR
jgi:hypothetical protein